MNATNMEYSEKTLRDYLEVVSRRKGPLIGITIMLSMITLAVAFGLPPVYRSKAVILIEQQEIPAELIRSTVTSYADQRIQIISQRVMTSGNLLDIIKKYDLYPREREKKPLEVVIEKMRDDIQLETVSADVIDPRSGQPQKATIAFNLSYENRSPDLAQKVTNELVSLYLNENLKTRTESAVQTSSFLTDEAEKLKSRVVELESRLAEFKEKNLGKLPEMISLNLELKARAESELEDVDRQLNVLEERRMYSESELQKIKPTQLYTETGERILGPADRLKVLETQYVSLSSKYAPSHPDVVRIKKEIDALKEQVGPADPRKAIELQLARTQSEFARTKKKYGSEHPDVKRLTRVVEGLEKELSNAPASAGKSTTNAQADMEENPSYVSLKGSLDAVTKEMDSLKERRKELKEKVTDYETKLAEAPQVEREYKALTRDHDNAVTKYQEITAKQMEAQVSQTLESQRKGERFTLIEPPQAPEKPAKPNRLAIVLLGTMLSVTSGLGGAAFVEGMDSSVRGRRQVFELLGAPPLATIPYIETASERHAQVIKAVVSAAGTIAAIISALFVVNAYVKPLDVLWYATTRNLGF